MNGAYDNGIELDQSSGNVRSIRNRFTNGYMPISVQPIFGGPAYVIRNLVVNAAVEQIKFHNATVGIVVLNNTFVSPSYAFQVLDSTTAHELVLENNLWVGPSPAAGGRTVNWDQPMDPATDTLDYDGYYPDGEFHFGYGASGATYPNFAAVAAGGRYEAHGHLLAAAIFASGLTPPATYMTAVPPTDVTLATTSDAIDRGVALPNVTDGYRGAAPDLGAQETGCAVPVYGVRPEGTDESNETLGCPSASGGDAGAPGSDDAGAASDGGVPSVDAGTTMAPIGDGAASSPGSHGDAGASGCGCRVGGGGPAGASGLGALVLGLGVLRRRRRASRAGGSRGPPREPACALAPAAARSRGRSCSQGSSSDRSSPRRDHDLRLQPHHVELRVGYGRERPALRIDREHRHLVHVVVADEHEPRRRIHGDRIRERVRVVRRAIERLDDAAVADCERREVPRLGVDRVDEAPRRIEREVRRERVGADVGRERRTVDRIEHAGRRVGAEHVETVAAREEETPTGVEDERTPEDGRGPEGGGAELVEGAGVGAGVAVDRVRVDPGRRADIDEEARGSRGDVVGRGVKDVRRPARGEAAAVGVHAVGVERSVGVGRADVREALLRIDGDRDRADAGRHGEALERREDAPGDDAEAEDLVAVRVDGVEEPAGGGARHGVERGVGRVR